MPVQLLQRVPLTLLPVPRTLAGLGEASHAFLYRDTQGFPAFAVLRFEAGGRKAIRPIVATVDLLTGKLGWRVQAPPEPRLLYGADELAKRPDAPVLVVEGEKTADEARQKPWLENYVVVTWPGGSRAVDKAAWKLLAGRKVTIFPDNDWPGIRAAWRIGDILHRVGAREVRVVWPPRGFPTNWDLADLPPPDWPERLPEGSAPEAVMAHLVRQRGALKALVAQAPVYEPGFTEAEAREAYGILYHRAIEALFELESKKALGGQPSAQGEGNGRV